MISLIKPGLQFHLFYKTLVQDNKAFFTWSLLVNHEIQFLQLFKEKDQQIPYVVIFKNTEIEFQTLVVGS